MITRAARSARWVIGGAAILLGCSACGFKGPLYLPTHRAAVVTHPPAASAPTSTAHAPRQAAPPSPVGS